MLYIVNSLVSYPRKYLISCTDRYNSMNDSFLELEAFASEMYGSGNVSHDLYILRWMLFKS